MVTVSESRQRGGTQPDPLSLDDVVDVALILTERLGLDALTIKAFADELGITSPGVYHYVSGKQELIDRLCERVTLRIDLTIDQTATWQEQIVTIMTGMGAAFARYPGVAARALSFVGPAPAALRITETIVAIVESEAGTQDEHVRDRTIDLIAALHFLFSGWLLGRSPIVDRRGIRDMKVSLEQLERTTLLLLAGHSAGETPNRVS